MARKRTRSSKSDSGASSILSNLSRSPSPPKTWSSRSGTADGEEATRVQAPAFKRRRVVGVAPVIAVPTVAPRVVAPRVGAVGTTSVSRTGRITRRSPSSSLAWMDPKSDEWDIKAVLESDLCLAYDPLSRRPSRAHSYIDRQGRLKDRGKYAVTRPEKPLHPKLRAHIQNGSVTPALRAYYEDLPVDVRLPIAGVIHESQFEQFFKDHVLTGLAGQEDGFHARPSIKLIIPDHIKAILVDDWENVTKNQQLVPLPSDHPVNSILADYLAFEQPKRIAGSAQADVLEEVVAGLKEYFEKCLGRILLYRFERNQYLEIRELWNAGTGEWAGKTAGDTYGAEHFCRLLVSLPELIAQTNMDQQSVNRLREELLKMTNWLGKNALKYFVSEYETPSQSYIEKARGY